MFAASGRGLAARWSRALNRRRSAGRSGPCLRARRSSDRARSGCCASCNSGAGADHYPELTAREHEILDRLAAAMPNSMIATRLGLSPKTVANHLSSIFTKLQVATVRRLRARLYAGERTRDSGSGKTLLRTSRIITLQPAPEGRR